jgi:OOP family OmpA-OmpF porin
MDDDHDGVNNCSDKCADTPKGAIVDKEGCWAFHGVLFDFDSDKVKSKYEPLIKNAVDVMKINPGLTVEIQGHTDSYGKDAYNQGLSERRAKSVKKELVDQGVNGNRLTTKGFGESQPVESNDTDEGRAYNRRVVYKRTDK